ncbi:Uncharacterised protein [Clostridium cochlearium]|nr:Uncharacterised protein [Clostridium cochlearium]
MNVIKKHMLHKAIKKFDYGDLVNLPLSLQDTCVLAIGPKSCIRIFYFQAKKRIIIINYICFQYLRYN